MDAIISAIEIETGMMWIKKEGKGGINNTSQSTGRTDLEQILLLKIRTYKNTQLFVGQKLR